MKTGVAGLPEVLGRESGFSGTAHLEAIGYNPD